MKICSRFFFSKYADVAKLADAPDLGSGEQSCRFKSCHPHQQETGILSQFPVGNDKK